MAKTANQTYWIGFDLGGTKIQASLFDDDLHVIYSRKKKTKGINGQEEGVERIIGLIVDVIEEKGLTVKDISGIGIGSPGPLDLNKGILPHTPNLNWENLALIFKQQFAKT